MTSKKQSHIYITHEKGFYCTTTKTLDKGSRLKNQRLHQDFDLGDRHR